MEIWWLAKGETESASIITGSCWYENNPNWGTYTIPGAPEASRRGSITAVPRISQGMDIWYVTPKGTTKSFHWYEGYTDGWRSGGTETNVDLESRITAFSEHGTTYELWWNGKDKMPHGISSNINSPFRKNLERDDRKELDFSRDPIKVPNFMKPCEFIVRKEDGLLYKTAGDDFELIFDEKTLGFAVNDLYIYAIDLDHNIRELVSGKLINENRNTVQITAAKDKLYRINNNGTIYRYDAGVWHLIEQRSDAKKIAISRDGDLYKISSNGALMKYDGQNWENFEIDHQDYRNAKEIAVSSNGDVFKVNHYGDLYRYAKGSRVPRVPETLDRHNTVSIAVQGEWVTRIALDGKIYRYNIKEKQWTEFMDGEGSLQINAW